MHTKLLRTLIVLSLGAALLACNLVSLPLNLASLAPTQTALQGQINRLGATATALAKAAPGAPPTDTGLQPPTATLAAPAAPAAPLTATLVPTTVVVPNAPQAPDLEEKRLYASARILLFEDMSASRYLRLVKDALDQAGYFYVDVGSAQGWFKTQLASNVDWDLVIAAAEADRQFGGEFFGLLRKEVESGSSAIVETWDLDLAPDGQAGQFLDMCGLQVQADWYMPDPPVFYWTQPEAAIFTTPNRLKNLRNARSIWSATTGDMGDLLKLRSSPPPPTDTLMLASENPRWSDHGLIASCLGGRVIIQTFRSHEYQVADVMALWQNYVHQALQQRFAHTGQRLPSPSITYATPSQPSDPLVAGPTPGPDYTFPHACGQALTARVLNAPRFSVDLFEHHAEGTFLQLRLELTNTGPEPVQVWAKDYLMSYSLNGQSKSVPIQKAATGFLYIEGGVGLWQTLLEPGAATRVALAFDVPKAAQDWSFSLSPGITFGQTVCSVTIPLTK